MLLLPFELSVWQIPDGSHPLIVYAEANRNSCVVRPLNLKPILAVSDEISRKRVSSVWCDHDSIPERLSLSEVSTLSEDKTEA